jgi:death-on-curing family protein
MIKILTVKEIEYIAFKLARELLTFNEPIPDFSTRFPNILESCLAAPFQSFSKKQLYKGLVEKTSTLFYLLIKNRPFKSGNQTMAITALLVFLYKNKKWIKVDTQELYNFTIWVAQSPPRLKDETVKATENFIKMHLIDLF